MGLFTRKKDKKEETVKSEPAPAEKKIEKDTPTESAPAKTAPAKKTEATKEKAADTNKAKVWHITKRAEDGKWQVKAEGASKATKLFRTKAEAEEYVKTLKANNEGSRVVPHKKDGKYQKK